MDILKGEHRMTRVLSGNIGKHQFMMKAILVFILAQQIYFPQTYKYYHLALPFVIFLFSDLFLWKQRLVDLEKKIIYGGAIAGSVSLVEGLFSLDLGLLYLGVLLAMTFYGFMFFKAIMDRFKSGQAREMLSEQNQSLYTKGKGFMTVLSGLLVSMQVGAGAYIVYEIIIRFI